MYLHAVLQNYATAQTEHGLRRLAFEWAQRRLRKNANAKKKNIYSKTESTRRSSHYNNHTRSACIFHANSECKQIMKLMQWPY